MKWLFTLACIAGILWLLIGCGAIEYSDGSRVGVVTKFSHKGFLFKTYEGELLVGAQTGTAVPRQWRFSVVDDKVGAQLERAMRNGKRVELLYSQRFATASWQSDTSYWVREVREVE